MRVWFLGVLSHHHSQLFLLCTRASRSSPYVSPPPPPPSVLLWVARYHSLPIYAGWRPRRSLISPFLAISLSSWEIQDLPRKPPEPCCLLRVPNPLPRVLKRLLLKKLHRANPKTSHSHIFFRGSTRTLLWIIPKHVVGNTLRVLSRHTASRLFIISKRLCPPNTGYPLGTLRALSRPTVSLPKLASDTSKHASGTFKNATWSPRIRSD